MGAKKGEKLHGRVEEGAVTASGPGMETMDQNADGVGLTTLASSPTAGRQVNEKTADTINPNITSTRPTEPVDRSLGPAVKPGPPRHHSKPTLHNRTLPSQDTSGGEVQEVAMSHEIATGNEVEGGEMDNKDRQAHKGIDNERSQVEMSKAKAIRNQGCPTTTMTSASALSALCDHLDEDAMMTDPGRPSRDPEDIMSDD